MDHNATNNNYKLFVIMILSYRLNQGYLSLRLYFTMIDQYLHAGFKYEKIMTLLRNCLG